MIALFRILFVALTFISSAYACGPRYTVRDAWGGLTSFTGGTPGAACAAVSGPLGNWGQITSTELVDAGKCKVFGTYNSGGGGYWIYIVEGVAGCAICADTITLLGESGYGTAKSCSDDGCVVTTTKVPYIDMQGFGSDSYYSTWTRTTTSTDGETCNAATYVPPTSTEVANDPNVPFAPCPENTSYGHINDVEVCVPNGNNIAGFEPYTGTGTGTGGTGTGGTGTGGTGTGGTGTGTGFGDGSGGDPGNLEPEQLETKTINLPITPVSGISRSGSCPSPRSVSIQGHSYEFSFQMFCDFASMIRPLIIAFAWLSAIASFFSFSRN